ncbi:MAG: Cas9 inhibitor AcrIIA9 family protein [Oscillospiraceae bacterium]|nr:Cas9 inhibitor AcrIIA9 family protein [Oscillospiraceae bacterium]
MTTTNPITRFEGEYSFLSNFHECEISHDDLVFQSVEAAFQSMKCQAHEERIPFQQMTASEARQAGRKVQLRPDWEEQKLHIMYALVTEKFSSPDLRQKLLGTGEAKLLEGNNWHDNYWGSCGCPQCKGTPGHNYLGKILTRVRGDLAAMPQEEPKVPAEPVPLPEPPAEDAGKQAEAQKAAEDEKRRAHEEAEAKRKADFDAAQAKKKEADQKAIAELEAMGDDDVKGASVEKIGVALERLTRRNMKQCVTQHLQEECEADPAFARLTMHPRKSMLNCFRYINRKAMEYLKAEMETLDEKQDGNGIGGDVPDDLCYQWALEYFRDPDAEEDKGKKEEFVPKPYYGGGSSAKKKKESKPKKEPAPKKTPKAPKAAAPAQEQMSLFGGAVAAVA